MPQKNTIKISVENSYYHIYNRGVEKRKIFKDDQDYRVFLNYLKETFSPPEKKENLPKFKVNVQGTTFYRFKRPPKNFYGLIDLIAYCLMPNHFHLMIKQITKHSMASFMRSISTRYSMYFNKKYEREGTLFQGIYKAVLIETEPHFLHLTRYIHLNRQDIESNFTNWYTSYPYYLGLKKSKWVNPGPILAYFKGSTIPEIHKIKNYKDFVEKYKKDSNKVLGELILE